MPNIETCYPGLCRCADKKDCEHSTAYWAVMMDQVAGTVRTITAGLEGVEPASGSARVRPHSARSDRHAYWSNNTTSPRRPT